MRYFIAAFALLLIPACSTGSPEPTQDEKFAQAICADLRDGQSLFQIHSTALDYYRETRDTSEDANQLASAKLQDLATREYCPKFRADFEKTLLYEKWVKNG